MKQLMLIILAVTLSPLSVAQTSDKREVSSSIEGELIKLEQQKDQAYLLADKEALGRLYAEEFTAINAGGGISSGKISYMFTPLTAEYLILTNLMKLPCAPMGKRPLSPACLASDTIKLEVSKERVPINSAIRIFM